MRSVRVIVVERRSFRVLVGMKSWTKKLNVPGGRVDRGEPPRIAGLRELHEESGVKLEGAFLVGRAPWVGGAPGLLWELYLAFVDEPMLIPGPVPHSAHEVALSWGVRGHKWMSFAEIVQSRNMWNPYDWLVFPMLHEAALISGDTQLLTAMARTTSAWKTPLKL